MSISKNIDAVQQLFRSVLDSSDSAGDIEMVDERYMSIPYEAHSARLATFLLQSGDNLQEWEDFYKKHSNLHGNQLFVGLGWGGASSGKEDLLSAYLQNDEALFRVYDGVGYFYGLFKRRDSIRQQIIPNFTNETQLYGYLQGLGRSVFYTTQGDPERCAQTIELFNEEHRHHLWRGIGLAFMYVGGFNNEDINHFLNESATFAASFKCGVVLAYIGRSKAENILPENNEILLKLGIDTNLFSLDNTEVISSLKKIESSLELGLN